MSPRPLKGLATSHPKHDKLSMPRAAKRGSKTRMAKVTKVNLNNCKVVRSGFSAAHLAPIGCLFSVCRPKSVAEFGDERLRRGERRKIAVSAASGGGGSERLEVGQAGWAISEVALKLATVARGEFAIQVFGKDGKDLHARSASHDCPFCFENGSRDSHRVVCAQKLSRGAAAS